MALREIRVIGDPVLRTPCDPITDIDASVKALVEDLQVLRQTKSVWGCVHSRTTLTGRSATF